MSSLKDIYANSGMDLLARYAIKGVLKLNEPLPIVQALTDAYLFKRIEPSLRSQVVLDGVSWVNAARQISALPLLGEKPLVQMPLEQLLLWADRSLVYGGYSTVDFYTAKNSRFNSETARFHFMDMNSLNIAKRLVSENNLLVPGDVVLTARNILLWLWSKNKYRRYYFADIEEIYNNYPNSDWAKQVYEESLYEKEHGLTNIAMINGVQINKGIIFSPSFQLPYVIENGLFYGNCVDVAAMAMGIYKSLGIPSFMVTYGGIKDGTYDEYHSIVFFYSTKHRAWLNFELGSGASNPLEDAQVLFEIIRPQMGSYLVRVPVTSYSQGATVSNRLLRYVVGLDRWNQIYSSGFSEGMVRRLMLPVY